MLKFVVCLLTVAASVPMCSAQVCPHYVWMHYAGYCSYYATTHDPQNPNVCGEPVNFDSADCSYERSCPCSNPVTVLTKRGKGVADNDLMDGGYAGDLAVWLSAEASIPRLRVKSIGNGGRRATVDPLTLVRRKNKLISFQHPGTGETRYVQVVTAVVVPPESTEVNPKPTEPKVLRRGFEIAPPLSGNDTDPVDALEKSITEILPPIDQSQAGNTTTELQTLARIRKSGTELYRRALLYRDADGAVIVVLHHATDALLP